MVKPKKNLGQHFLTDKNIASKISKSINNNGNILEVGPGTGMLTQYFITQNNINFYAIETDKEAYNFLTQKYPDYSEKFILADFLKYDLQKLFDDNKFSIIGNFPYNISSQIFFKVLDNKDNITEVVGMVQKEVAERIREKSTKITK